MYTYYISRRIQIFHVVSHYLQKGKKNDEVDDFISEGSSDDRPKKKKRRGSDTENNDDGEGRRKKKKRSELYPFYDWIYN